MLKDELIPANVALCFEEELASHRLDVDDVRDRLLDELKDDEGAHHARVCSCIERDELQRDVGKVGCLQEMPGLCTHDRWATHLAPEGRFVHDAPQLQRSLALENLLPGHADLDPALDLITVGCGEAGPNDGAGVVLGLEQTRHK